MPAPDVTDVATYLGADSSWETGDIESAYNAEKASQARTCRVPTDEEEWPADLVEALCRRVQHNLALRRLPLGVQTSMSEAAVSTSRVGGTDAEVRRLEGPHRKLVCG